MRTIEWDQLHQDAALLAKRNLGLIDGNRCCVYGIPRGGVPVALLVAECLRGLDVSVRIVDDPSEADLIVDDLVDSGDTLRRHDTSDGTVEIDALYRKPHSPLDVAPDAVCIDDWIVFPWELHDESAGPTDAVTRLIELVGENPKRDGLERTPERVVRALTEMCAGYAQDPAAILATSFADTYDEMVLVQDIEFTSLCEHHMLPFTGTCTIGYVPAGQRVVGVSKLPRLVQCFALRLQIQERLTQQIAEALMTHLDPVGVGVVVRAEHSCMACRGIRSRAPMVTSSMLGAMREKPEARAEFLALAHPRHRP